MSEAQAMISGPAVNYWAVLVAAVVYWIIGAVWYAKPLFGDAWMRGIGKTEEQVKADFKPLNLVWVLLFSVLAAYGIARIDFWYPGTGVWDAIVIAGLAWFCFAMAVMFMNDVMEKRPCSLTLINACYHLIGFVAMGAIIGLWH